MFQTINKLRATLRDKVEKQKVQRSYQQVAFLWFSLDFHLYCLSTMWYLYEKRYLKFKRTTREIFNIGINIFNFNAKHNYNRIGLIRMSSEEHDELFCSQSNAYSLSFIVYTNVYIFFIHFYTHVLLITLLNGKFIFKHTLTISLYLYYWFYIYSFIVFNLENRVSHFWSWKYFKLAIIDYSISLFVVCVQCVTMEKE